jgi:hypothetical protein
LNQSHTQYLFPECVYVLLGDRTQNGIDKKEIVFLNCQNKRIFVGVAQLPVGSMFHKSQERNLVVFFHSKVQSRHPRSNSKIVFVLGEQIRTGTRVQQGREEIMVSFLTARMTAVFPDSSW